MKHRAFRITEWKAFYHQIQNDDNSNMETLTNSDTSNTDITTPKKPVHQHSDIRVSNFSQAPFQHPLMDELKLKLLGWIANHKPKTPKSNLSPCELRGKSWIEEKIKRKSLFVTKADKGGAILIMNYADVEECITKEIFNNNKFEEIHQTNADEHIFTVRKRVNDAAIELQRRGKISQDDKTIITGLTDKNKPKQAPEYRAESPYTYPSFKIHKLQKEEIAEKKVPPVRLIHASKFSPLYRMEKWTSPYLTKMSRRYCKKEFILDTKHILKMMNDLYKQL